VQPAAPSLEYENELRTLLAARDWEALRGFTCRWEVLMHKLTCSRIDLLGLHDDSRGWLERHGYTADLGGV
jgi:hypothetical protein